MLFSFRGRLRPRTLFFSYQFDSRSGPPPESCERVMRNIVLYCDWGFFPPSSAEAWPLTCSCILGLTLLRATAPNEKSCQLLPELELNDSSRDVRMSIPRASRGSFSSVCICHCFPVANFNLSIVYVFPV